MNNFLRQTIAALIAVTLVLTPAIPANAMTKKQVNNQITKLQKQIRKDRSSYNAALKKDQDTANGYLKLEGTLYSYDSNTDSYIVKMYNTKTQVTTYYHFKGDKNLTIIQENDGNTKYVTGYAVVSKKVYDFYGVQAYESVAKEAPHAASDKQASIEKSQARIKSLKNSKKETIFLESTYSVGVGQSLTLTPTFKYNTSDINKITWKSSNTKVVKVSKNGNLLGIAPGTATVSAKLSVTGKTYKTTVNVIAQ